VVDFCLKTIERFSEPKLHSNSEGQDEDDKYHTLLVVGDYGTTTWLIKPQFVENQPTSDKAIISKIDKSNNLQIILDKNRGKNTWLGNIIKFLEFMGLVRYGINLSSLNLEHMNLSTMNFNDVSFSNCNLRHANLTNSNFSNAIFSCADLTETVFSFSFLNSIMPTFIKQNLIIPV
jgi:hypothetical protein